MTHALTDDTLKHRTARAADDTMNDETRLLPIGLRMDGVDMYTNLSMYVGDAGYLQVYPDPVILPFSNLTTTLSSPKSEFNVMVCI